jgi:hypothetical protein
MLKELAKLFVGPVLWCAFFFLLGGVVGLNWPFGLLVIAIVLHLIANA